MIVKYNTFKIPKRNGKMRKIEQPIDEGMDYLKEKLEEVEQLEELKPSPFSFAFMRGRNIVSCAKQHHGKKYVARMDIKDFFGSITLEKFVKYVDIHFKKYSKIRRAKLIEKIKPCFKYDEKLGEHTYLPQGAPTSPFLSNVYMRFFDWRMAWFCMESGVVFNRYADDMFFSGDDLKKIYGCFSVAKNYLKDIKLEENKDKRKIMKDGQRMAVVGVVINKKFQVPKKTRKIIRAILHNAKRDDVELTNEQKGLIAFKDMVDNYDNFKKDNILICEMIHVAHKI